MSRKPVYGSKVRRLPKSLLAGVVLIGLSIGRIWGQSSPQAGKTAQQAYKNIQVLKDVPAYQLIPAMEFISTSLGVECGYCHVRAGFEKDDKKPKDVARHMIQMMSAINAQNFEGKRQVTCYTCHRGAAMPVPTPIVDETAPLLSEAWDVPAQTTLAPNLPAANDVLQKYVAALGGVAAIEKIASRDEKGHVSFGGGPPLPLEILTKDPDKQIMTVHLQSGDNISAVNGQTGWLKAPGSPVREMGGADLESGRLDADLQFATHLTKTFSDFKVMGPERIGDRDVIVVLAKNAKQPPLALYFDKESGLLLRQVRFAESPLGLNPTRIDYANYKVFDGVQVPLQTTTTRANRKLDMTIDEVEQNIPVSDSKFQHE